MRPTALCSFMLLAASTLAPAASLNHPATVLDMDATRTKVGFTLADVLHTVHGNFKLKSGSIQFDPETGAAGGSLVVDAASGASGSEGRDRRMRKNILETDKYPEIVFTPDHFEGRLAPAGDSVIALHGMFTIHGGSHELVLQTTVHREGDRLTAAARFVVPYVAWGMKNPSTLFLRVSDKVDIDLEVAGRITTE
jgi:polyisoprenoid-binding protein YceI